MSNAKLIRTIKVRLKLKQINWLEDMVRMEKDRKPRQIMEVRPEGKRKRGKPWF